MSLASNDLMTSRQGTAHPYLIIGGGIAGCTLAYELSKRGEHVTLLERGIVGQQGASAVPVALLNPYRGRSAKASSLDRAGLEATWSLTRELGALGFDAGARKSGVLRIASNRKQAKLWQTREGLRWLRPEDVPKSYHAPFGAALVLEGGWLEPRKVLLALVQAATQRGARIVEQCEVSGLEPQADGYLVDSTQGPLRAHTVILCLGTGTVSGVRLPGLEHLAGDVIGLRSEVAIPYPLAGAIYGLQRGEDFYLGGNHRPANESDPTAPAQLQRSGSWFIPALKTAHCTSVWTGTRAKTKDHRPVVRELTPNLWFFGALAGRGFLCAAQLAGQLAERLTDRDLDGVSHAPAFSNLSQ